MITVASQDKPWPVIYDQRGSQSVKKEASLRSFFTSMFYVMKATEISDLDLLTFFRRLSKTEHRRFHIGEYLDYRRSVCREHRCLARVLIAYTNNEIN